MDQAKGTIRTVATAQDPSLVRCFRGHQKTVNSIDFSKEMKQLVSAGSDGLVQVWSFKPQIRPFKFVGHKGSVNDVLFNSSATKVYSCGQDRQIRIWKNTVNGKNKAIKAHSGTILKLSLSRDQDFLMSCSSDKTIKMWTPQGKFKQSFTGHANWVRQCTISPDQRMLLSCSDDKTVKLWDIQRTAISISYNQHKSQVLSCKFTPDGTCVAGASIDGTIKIWDTRLNKLIQHYNAHDTAINQINFHPLGSHMTSVSNDNKIKIWNLKKGTLQWTLYGHSGQIKCLNFSEKGDYFATGGADKLVMVWMTNFDKQMYEKGRKIQSNFRQKVNGQGVQPLFKSNIHNYRRQQQPDTLRTDLILGQTNGKLNIPDENPPLVISKKSTKISQLMSFQLQKLVNQLQHVTQTLNTMDKHLTQHQHIIQRLQNTQTTDNILTQYQNRKLLIPSIYNSAWQAQRNIQINSDFVDKQIMIMSQKQQYQNQQLKQFIQQEQNKKKIFLKQLEKDDDNIEFKTSEIKSDFQ